MNDRREDLLRRVLERELDEQDGEVARAAAEDARFAAELEATLGLRAALDAEAAERASLTSDAARRAGDPGEELVMSFVRARVDEARTRRLVRRAAIVTLLAAAAILVVMKLGRRDAVEKPPRSAPPDTVLGTGQIRLLAPLGNDGDCSRFSFESSLQGGTFRVTVVDVRGEVLPGGESPHLEGTEWRPDPGDVAGWPKEFEWEVQWFDGTGAPVVTSDPARVSRP